MGNSQAQPEQPEAEPAVEEEEENDDDDSEAREYLNEWPTSPNEFPDMFRESAACTYSAIAIFVVADLRRLAQAGHFSPNPDGTGDVLSFPIRFVTDIAPIWDQNKDLLKRKMKRIEFNTFDQLTKFYYEDPRLHYEMEGGVCFSMGDERSTKECVYGIMVNSIRKTITLVFRGSITLQDWVQDAKTPLRSINNPLFAAKSKIEESQENVARLFSDLPDRIPIHSGFMEYLYKEDENYLVSTVSENVELAKKTLQGKNGNDASDQVEGEAASSEGLSNNGKNKKTKMSKIDHVMQKIEELYAERPDYKLYITGHSLGGALSLIAAVEATVRFSLLQDRPPVTCITLGNPKAGGSELRRTIHALENMHKLRVLCIHNANDLVPLLPNSFCFSNVHLKSYMHAGMQLRMLDNERTGESTFSLRYRGKTRQIKDWSSSKERIRRFSAIAPCLHRIAERHFYGNYLMAINGRREALNSLYLNDFYKKLSDDW